MGCIAKTREPFKILAFASCKGMPCPETPVLFLEKQVRYERHAAMVRRKDLAREAVILRGAAVEKRKYCGLS
jgi:hypothetical protein